MFLNFLIRFSWLHFKHNNYYNILQIIYVNSDAGDFLLKKIGLKLLGVLRRRPVCTSDGVMQMPPGPVTGREAVISLT